MKAVVNVTVKEIPEEAVMQSGSIRFMGITKEQFIKPDARVSVYFYFSCLHMSLCKSGRK